jgi:hypothetical protein
MKIDGNRQCGAITFEAEVDPNGLTICHRADCRGVFLDAAALAAPPSIRPASRPSASGHW